MTNTIPVLLELDFALMFCKYMIATYGATKSSDENQLHHISSFFSYKIDLLLIITTLFFSLKVVYFSLIIIIIFFFKVDLYIYLFSFRFGFRCCISCVNIKLFLDENLGWPYFFSFPFFFRFDFL